MKTQMKQALWVMVVMTGLVAATGSSYAQAPAAPQKAEAVVVPLKVTVVITRHKSDKAQTVLSRLPFELWVNTGSDATMRISSEVPVPTTTVSKDEATGKMVSVPTWIMRPVGTSVTVNASDLGDGRFQLKVSLNDSQYVPFSADVPSGAPRTASNSLQTTTAPIVRDGQTVQHSLATDRVTGDMTKIEVTLNVVK